MSTVELERNPRSNWGTNLYPSVRFKIPVVGRWISEDVDNTLVGSGTGGSGHGRARRPSPRGQLAPMARPCYGWDMGKEEDDLQSWLIRELGPAGYRRLKAMQDRGLTLEQALEADAAIKRLKRKD